MKGARNRSGRRFRCGAVACAILAAGGGVAFAAEATKSAPGLDTIPCVDPQHLDAFPEGAVVYRRLRNVVYHPEKGLKGDLYMPDGGGPHPAVLFIHGGGWVAGSRRMANAPLWGEHLACRGYAMFDIDYELAPRNHAPGLVQDCKCALRWLKGEADVYGLDREKVFVTGGSAGGHLSAMVALTAKDSYFDPTCSTHPGEDLSVAGGIPFYGIHDLNLLVQHDYRSILKVLREAYIGRADASAADLARESPVTYAAADSPPLLIVHGKADSAAPYGQSVRLHEVVQSKGGRSELLLLDGANHAFDFAFGTPWTNQALEAVDRFLDKWSGR